ncbi:MAG: hypothetical protein WCI73_00980 [Phycisphaerae bacterium]
MESNHVANIFRVYEQEENNFTNGLCALMLLASCEDPGFIELFLKKLLQLRTKGRMVVRILREIQLADAELCGRDCCLRFETKVESGTLRHEQVRRHLRELGRQKGRLKRLILLTPDDSASSYIKSVLATYKPMVLHLEWRKVFEYLRGKSARQDMSRVLSELMGQFLETIEERIFEQDMAGVVTKISFGKDTEVFPETTPEHTSYLDELLTDTSWNTPRPYKELDGKGRKLLLYDRTREAITAEVEIKKVERVPYARTFSSSNVFAGRPTIFSAPIGLSHIRSIPGFENFGKYRKDRCAYRNLTREQYRLLVGPANKGAV